MEPSRSQKVIIICLLVLKLIQFSLQIATAVTTGEAYEEIWFLASLVLNIFFTFGNIIIFVYEIVETVKFELESIVAVFLMLAYVATISITSIDLKKFLKSSDTSNPQVTNEDVKLSYSYEEVSDYKTIYIKAITFMALIIFIQVIVYYLVRKVTYDGPVLWFLAKCVSSDEEEIPLQPFSPPSVSFQEGSSPSVSIRTTRTSQREPLETEEIEYGEQSVYFTPSSIDFLPKKSAVVRKTKDDGDCSLQSNICRMKRMQFRHIGEGRSHQCSNFHRLEFPYRKEEKSDDCSTFHKSPKQGEASNQRCNYHKSELRCRREEKYDNCSTSHKSPKKGEASHQCGNFHKLEFPYRKEEKSDDCSTFHKSPKKGEVSHQCGNSHKLEFPYRKEEKSDECSTSQKSPKQGEDSHNNSID